MADFPKLDGILHNLRNYLGYLLKIARTERKAFLDDPTQIGAAKYYLQTSIEACLNLGTHIISTVGFRAPRDYRDVFSVLHENGILPDDLTVKMRQMAGFRNRLVHLYWEIDDELIYEYLQRELGDFDEFVQYILRFVEQSSTQE